MQLNKRSSVKYSYLTNKRISNIQRAINMLAYGSLVLDVLIAIVTTLSLLNITTGEFVLVPIHYMLTSVVVMSLISGGMLLYLKHYERIITELLRIKYKVRLPMPSPRTRYSLKWAINRKLEKIKFKLFG
jgi:hypothetical protein